MPRNPGTGIYTKPAPDVLAGTTVESKVYNDFVNDVELDLNAARPIVAGGTGATNATQARDNLDAEVAGVQVTNYDSHVFEAGSFWSAPGATGAPPLPAYYFSGQCDMVDSTLINLEARCIGDPSRKYLRQKAAGSWGPWTGPIDGTDKVSKTGDTMSGNLTIANAGPILTLRASGATSTAAMHLSRDNVLRWIITSSPDADSGAAGGADLLINRYYNTSGAFIDTPLGISRATGQVNIGQTLAVGSHATIGGNVTINGNLGVTLGVVSAAGLSTTGTTTTGTLTVTGHSQQVDITNTGQLLNDYGRVISKGGSSPSFAMWNPVVGAFGMWLSADGYLSHGTTDATGAATGLYTRLSAARFECMGSINAYKTGGGPWTDSSDARIKNVLGDYANGLDAIKTLRPVTYTYKGNDTTAGAVPSNKAVPNPDDPISKEAVVAPYANSPHYGVQDREFIGLIAQECEAAFPEMVTQAAGTIDGQPVTDMRTLDTGPLLFAAINSIKELAARVEALEAQINAAQ